MDPSAGAALMPGRVRVRQATRGGKQRGSETLLLPEWTYTALLPPPFPIPRELINNHYICLVSLSAVLRVSEEYERKSKSADDHLSLGVPF